MGASSCSSLSSPRRRFPLWLKPAATGIAAAAAAAAVSGAFGENTALPAVPAAGRRVRGKPSKGARDSLPAPLKAEIYNAIGLGPRGFGKSRGGKKGPAASSKHPKKVNMDAYCRPAMAQAAAKSTALKRKKGGSKSLMHFPSYEESPSKPPSKKECKGALYESDSD